MTAVEITRDESTRLRFVRPRELARMKTWDVQESDVETFFVTTDDDWQVAVTHYRDLRTDKPTRRHPVLLCHGLAANRLGFDLDPQNSLPAYLVAQGFDVYSVDLRGHGLSEKPGQRGKTWTWSFNDYCDRDWPAVIDAILGHSDTDRLHLIGHSMGGILLYARTGLGDERFKSGITLGSALDYSGLPTFFTTISPLGPATHVVRRVPIDWSGRSSSFLTRFSPKFIDKVLVVADNVDVTTYRKMGATVFHPTSGRVLRDLARAINGKGMKAASGEHYEALLTRSGYPFPILAVAGTKDVQCSPDLTARFGTDHMNFGRSEGQQHDYSHHDLVMGINARTETWPVYRDWLVDND